jgi:hypothetical protein
MTSKLRIALGVLAVGLVAIAPAGGALVAPAPVGPSAGVAVDSLPAFRWNPVTGADHYEFELAADPGFNSTLSVVNTKNTRAALKKVIPNGTYHWRVRAVASGGALGTWSASRTLEMKWTAQPALLAPSDQATISYPQDALRLRWSPVPGAAKYEVKVATDPNLGSLIWEAPVETAATSFAFTAPLGPGVYYWGITPLDAEGHAGTRSTTASFTWRWPSTTNPKVTDLVADPEVYDPQFSWDLVPGAAGYEVEVNFQQDWAPGSKVCCDPIIPFTKISTLGTSLSPAEVLPNNAYYWRVRAVDSSGHAGDWNVGPSFTKTFANVPPMIAPSVKNLRVVDGNLDALATGSTAATPIVLWDPVPGASAYQVGVTPFGAGCDWGASTLERWDEKTATTGWTPLGWSRGNGADPLSDAQVGPPSSDLSTHLTPGEDYCVRVRPVDHSSDIQGPEILGDWTYLPANNVPAFTWSGPPAAGDCDPCALTAGDYLRPVTGTTTDSMPVFTWNEVPGAQSYFVVVARDANFNTVVDYAYTRVPAYAPRESSQTKGYADESTSYYWAVLPARNAEGSGTSADLLESAPRNFVKRVTPSTLLGPVGGAAVNTAATTFRWTGVEGARRYRLEVASDSNFSGLADDPVYSVLIDSTAYTSNWTFPSDRTLYWRVRADAEDGPAALVGLTWSETGTFRKQLPRPVFDPGNPSTGAGIPSFSWSPIPGAISYDLQVREADGDDPIYEGFATHAASFVRFTGVGVTQVFVRANFPTQTGQLVDGPWSEPWSYTHTIPEPSNPAHEAGANRLLLSWSPRPAADEYRVQISQRPDFAVPVENATTQTTAYAPLLNTLAYTNGGTFWWRVAMVDADRNVGDYTAARSFTLPKTSTSPMTSPTTTRSRFSVGIKGWPALRRYRTITLSVRNHLNKPVYRAAVRVSGAGVGARTKYTSRYGKVAFRLRATRYPSFLTFRITKPGYYAKTVIRPVRPA